MTNVELQKIEKIAAQSESFARKALRKSNELTAYLSLLEYRARKTTKHVSINALFKKLNLK